MLVALDAFAQSLLANSARNEIWGNREAGTSVRTFTGDMRHSEGSRAAMTERVM